MFTQAGLFLLDALIGFFTFALLLRFYMQAFRVSFRNQVGAFVVQLTNGLVMPVRKVLPGLFGLDLASLLLAYALQALWSFARNSVEFGLDRVLGNWPIVVFLGAFLATLRISLLMLIGALILQAVLSWVSPYSPLATPLAQLTRPFTDPIRRVVPPIAGVDLSLLIALLLAQALLFFVVPVSLG